MKFTAVRDPSRLNVGNASSVSDLQSTSKIESAWQSDDALCLILVMEHLVDTDGIPDQRTIHVYTKSSEGGMFIRVFSDLVCDMSCVNAFVLEYVIAKLSKLEDLDRLKVCRLMEKISQRCSEVDKEGYRRITVKSFERGRDGNVQTGVH